MKPKGKCFAKKCEDCNWLDHWDLVNSRGEKKIELQCSIRVLINEIPKIIGAMDGLQSGVNEARNSSDTTKKYMAEYGKKAVDSFKLIIDNKKQLGDSQ